MIDEINIVQVAADKKHESGKGVGGQEGEQAKSTSRKRHNTKLSRPVSFIELIPKTYLLML